MKKLILLLLFIPLVFSCSSTDDVSKTPEINIDNKNIPMVPVKPIIELKTDFPA